MQLTRKAEYAIRIMLDLASNDSGKPIMSKEIAKRQDIPLKFLFQIIQNLKKSGLIETIRGNGGGIILGKKTSQINLKQIIESVEGPIALNQCLIDKKSCNRSSYCPLHTVWGKAQEQMLSVLETTTLKDVSG